MSVVHFYRDEYGAACGVAKYLPMSHNVDDVTCKSCRTYASGETAAKLRAERDALASRVRVLEDTLREVRWTLHSYRQTDQGSWNSDVLAAEEDIDRVLNPASEVKP